MSGPPPRAVDGEEPQPGRRQTVQVAVGVGHQFVGLLRGRVQAHGMIDVVCTEKGIVVFGPVHGARRGVDEMAHARMTAAFEHVDEADEVAVDVGVRMGQRVADSRLGRQVDYNVEPLRLEQPRHGRPVSQIELLKAEPRMRFELRQPVLSSTARCSSR